MTRTIYYFTTILNEKDITKLYGNYIWIIIKFKIKPGLKVNLWTEILQNGRIIIDFIIIR